MHTSECQSFFTAQTRLAPGVYYSLTDSLSFSLTLSDKASERRHSSPNPGRDFRWDQAVGHRLEAEAMAYDWGVWLKHIPFLFSIQYMIKLFFLFSSSARCDRNVPWLYFIIYHPFSLCFLKKKKKFLDGRNVKLFMFVCPRSSTPRPWQVTPR